MNLGELKTLFFGFTDDPHQTLTTNNESVAYLNRALESIYIDLLQKDICEQRHTDTLAFTSSSYEQGITNIIFPVQKLLQAYFNDDGRGLKILPEEQARNSSGPAIYYVTNLIIGYYRKSDVSIDIVYAPVPTVNNGLLFGTSDDGVEPSLIPHLFRQLLPMKAAMLRLIGNRQRGEELFSLKSEYSEELQRLLAGYSHGKQDQVTDTEYASREY